MMPNLDLRPTYLPTYHADGAAPTIAAIAAM